MIKNVNEFVEVFKKTCNSELGKSYNQLSEYEAFRTLVDMVDNISSDKHSENRVEYFKNQEKEIYYFSMEFLIGRLLKEYLVNLECLDIARDGMKNLGFDIDKLFEFEKDPGLGNGGLGRLAACFLDSMASLGINGMGMGLKYKFGLFKQKIVHGNQIELPDDWLSLEFPWERVRRARAKLVKFGGVVDRVYENGKMEYIHRDYREVLAIPCDVPVIGYGGESSNKLRLWTAEPKEEKFDLDAFNKGDYAKAADHRTAIEAMTYILYPDDSNHVGKRLRLEQEYLLVSAGIQDIVSRFKKGHVKENSREEWLTFPKKIAIHINDTHPTMCIPELIRILIDEENLSWDDAVYITKNSIAYTNHTVMPEALEKWPVNLMRETVPRVFMIIEEIDRRHFEMLDKMNGSPVHRSDKNAVIFDNNVHMANLSVIMSHSVNGVAALHTEIIKNQTLNELYKIEPDKFSNKTNGVSHRRFLMSANEDLTKLLVDKIGKNYITNPSKLTDFLKYENDEKVLNALSEIKIKNKMRLAKYIKEHNHIDVNVNSIFDIQVKRIHAYKRQLLFIFKVLHYYNEIKKGNLKDFYPHTYILAGKAAGSYAFAKKTIKLFNNIAHIINNDPDMDKYMKVVFIENFCVSNAELIYPAADISEQISLAGKEASGTGNMKFMFNGAVTLGTLDGANVEINNLVGSDNIKIFGLKEEEVERKKSEGYNPTQVVENDIRLKEIVHMLMDGRLVINHEKVDFFDIVDYLTKYGDEYMVAEDFSDYIKKSEELDEIYVYDKNKFNKMSLVNIAKSGYFSSDRTIKEYYDEIWNK